jgi:hypothetical protein
VATKTRECRAGTSGRYYFCHAEKYCQIDGTCST